MNAKDFLRQIRKLDKMIENKIAEAEQLKEYATSISPNMSGERVQSTGNPQKISDAIIRYVDLEREAELAKVLLEDKRREIIAVIEQLENPLHYSVLYKHYVQFKTFVQIADEEHYSYAYILEIHMKAVENIEKILNYPI